MAKDVRTLPIPALLKALSMGHRHMEVLGQLYDAPYDLDEGAYEKELSRLESVGLAVRLNGTYYLTKVGETVAIVYVHAPRSK